MKRNILVLLVCSLLLGGCWDEKLYKDITIVSLFGLEGEPGEIKAHFAFPSIVDKEINYLSATGEGISLREAGSDANHQVMERLDLSGLEVMFIAEDTAKSNLTNYIDSVFRHPRLRLNGYIAIIEGELAPYFEPSDKISKDLAMHYSELIRTAVMDSNVPDIDIQDTRTLLYDQAMDLSLPYMKMEEESGVAEIAGTALFSKKEYTGITLDKKESVIFNLLRNQNKKYARLFFMWKSGEEESPISLEVLALNKKWKISDGKIDASYELKLNVEEFPHDKLDKKKVMKDVEDFLSKEITKEFNDVMKKLQEAKSDGVGFGRTVRAFHTDLWDKGDWQETFSEIPITVDVKANITRTGVLN